MRFKDYLIEIEAIDKTGPPWTIQMQCMECGKKFKKKLGAKTFEVKCPKCGSYDTEPA